MTRRPSLERAIRLGVLGAVLAACGGTTVTEVRSDGPSPAIVGDVPADIDPVITAAPSTTRALVPMLQEAALGDGWSATVIGTRAYTSEQQIARFPDSPAIAETDRYKFVFVKYRYSGVEPVASLSDVVSGIVDDQLGNIGTSCGIQGIEANQLPTSTELVHQVCAVVSNDRLSSAQFAARVGTNRVVIFDLAPPTTGSLANPAGAGAANAVGPYEVTVADAAVLQRNTTAQRVQVRVTVRNVSDDRNVAPSIGALDASFSGQPVKTCTGGDVTLPKLTIGNSDTFEACVIVDLGAPSVLLWAYHAPSKSTTYFEAAVA